MSKRSGPATVVNEVARVAEAALALLEGEAKLTLAAAALAAHVLGAFPPIRGLHSSTVQLNVSII
jgi:hypothetical protein